MFCPNCGKQLPDGARFCGECGTRLETPAPQQAPKVEIPVEQPKPSWPKVEVPKVELPKIDIPEGPLSGLKSRSPFYFGYLLTLLLSIFFTGGMHLEMRASLWGFTETEATSVFLDAGGLRTFAILLFLFGMAMALLPLLTGGQWKRRHQVPAVVASVVNVLWLLFVLMMSKEEARQYGYGSDLVKVKLTFGGVMFLLLNLATIVLCVLSMKHDRKNAENQNQ